MNNSQKYNKNLNVIGDKIRYYREQKGLSQAQLSAKLELLGISIPKNSIQRLECNNRIIKDFELAGISKVLNVSIDLLLKDFINNLN
jgi:transcriptional regulator with XRE-family HTH domain